MADPAPAEEAEVIEAAEQAEQDTTGEHVVAFGCRAADRVLLACVPGQRHQAYTLTVPQCPGCGESHEVKAMPRPRRPGDEIAVSVDPLDNPTPASGSHAASKSDGDILDALSDDWKLVTDVAETLGYGNRGSLVNRLREMRRGAAIETRQENRIAPMFVRRAVKSD